ncbi:unnamed protein product, partial [Prorocentrum cordatum]
MWERRAAAEAGPAFDPGAAAGQNAEQAAGTSRSASRSTASRSGGRRRSEEEEEEEAEAEEEDRTSHRSSACRRQARRGPLGPLRTPEGGGGSAQQKAGERGGARSQPGRAWPASHCCYAYATFAAPEAPQGGPSADPRNPR